MKTVSIVTLSQYYRIDNLFLLKEMLIDQTYFNKITEWVLDNVVAPIIFKVLPKVIAFEKVPVFG